MTWKFETAGPDGLCNLFGVKIFNYDWHDCRETAVVTDPHYNVEKTFHVYEVEIEGKMRRFAAGEFSNGVWGFYLEQDQ
mgnify:CR=1 FL=1